jgi:3-methylcrotonyl-CoA carboxylase alpha subunit
VRVDSGFRAGDEVSAHYDPMLAKLIAWGEDREAARTELLRALSQCEVTGVATNVAFVERTVASDAFRDARIDTGFIDANRESLLPAIAEAPAEALLAASAAEYRAIEQAAKARASTSSDRHSPWTLTDAWWNGTDTHAIAFVFDDGTRERQVCVKPRADGSFDVRGDALRAHVRLTSRGERLAIERLDADGQTTLVATVVADRDVRHVFASGVRARLTRVNRLAHVDAAPERGGHLTAPMSGTIVAVMVKAGDEVRKGAPLVVLEAMKMEHSIVAPAAGRVAAVHFEVGDRVSEGADLVDVDVEERQ